MRTKPGVDSLSFDDLYNNLRVFEPDVKGSTGSSSSAQNVAFVSSESTSSTNDVNHEDLEHIDEFDLEEMDLKWQVAMIFIRLKKFYKKTGRKLQFDAKEPVSFDKTKVECFNCHKTGHFARECRSKGNQDIRRRDARNTGYKAKDNGRRPGKQEEPKALVTLDGDGVDWTGHAEDEQENFDLMAYSNSGSDTEREQLGDVGIEIQAYTLALAKKLLAEAVKEKDELKTKLEKWQNSSKGLNKLLDSQMSVKDKIGLGFSGQVKENELYDEALMSVFDSHSSDIEDAPVVETLESVPEPVVIEPKVVSQPKVWSDAPIIEEYESDSDDEYVIKPSKEQEKPSFAFSPRVDKRDWNGLMSKKLGLGHEFTRKACFVCGSFGHLIRDCDFHEKRMAKQVDLNKPKGKSTGQGENRPVWNNVQRLNHQNKFVPTTVLTRTGRFPVNTARHTFISQAISTSAARKVNAVPPIPRNTFYKTHLPIRRPFNRTTVQRTNFSNQKVNTVRDKAVSAVGGISETADDPHKVLKNKEFVDSGCSRHMTGNKAYLIEYQDYNGGPVASEGSKGYITGKGKIRTGKLDFKDVCFVKELHHFNLFSVSQMCEKKNKATVDKSNKWHRRLGHVNFKNLNKLVKGNLVRGLPSKIFQNDHTCVACQKGKQHKASCPKEANNSAGTQDNFDAGYSEMEAEPAQEYFVLPLWSSYTSTVKSSEAKNGGEKPNKDAGLKTNEEPVDQADQAFLEELERLKRQEKEAENAAKALRKEFTQGTEDLLLQAGAARASSTNTVNTVSTPDSTASPSRVFSSGRPSYPDLTNCFTNSNITTSN
ncbi:ribonuclease H-like domain-containing protein [Tanacetum coccineum]